MNATKRIKSLLIDDDLDDQEIFSLCLNDIDDNVQCRVANNGIDALDILDKDEEYTPDVIFLDINMPKMNGLACLEKLKEIPRLSDTQIYVYSTTSEGHVEEKSKRLGANGYIVKAPKTVQLKEKLARIMEICRQAKT
jgi:CheY-like chemotaxis protein